MRNRFPKTVSSVVLVLVAVSGIRAETDEAFEDWNLASSITSAQLVIVARSTLVSQVRIVEGAKTTTLLREFRFQPVRTLKGIYSRDELSMSDNDLNCAVVDPNAVAPIQEGEFRLLILTQRSGFSYGCAGTPSAPFEQSVPLLSGPDDPLVAVADAIVQATNARSRKERADILLEQLKKTDGVGVIPLLHALQAQGVFAARNPDATSVLAALAANPSPPIRKAALGAIHSVVRNLTDAQVDEKQAYALAVREHLERAELPTAERVQAIEVLGHLGRPGRELKWPAERLVKTLHDASTELERKTAIDAMRSLGDPSVTDAVVRSLELLPLDSQLELNLIATARALDPHRCAAALMDRIHRSLAARQSIESEVLHLGWLQHGEAIDVLLDAAQRRSVATRDKAAIAQALGRIGNERAVALLASWMRSADTNLRYPAIDALSAIDTKLAAQELRSWFTNEPYIVSKLKIARTLGRHGFDDGYSLAIEHLAENDMAVLASEALRSINDPRASEQLVEILKSRPDDRWMSASLTALAALDDEVAVGRLIDTLRDDRSPIILDAIKATTFLTDERVESLLVKLGQSRNDALAYTSLMQLRQRLRADQVNQEQPVSIDGAVVQEQRSRLDGPSIKALDTVLRDSYAPSEVRLEVLQILSNHGDESIHETLRILVDQTDLENTKLQLEAEKIIREKIIDL